MAPTPSVKGLDILNDCEENQKMVQKLTDWAASQWNCKVMTDEQKFPNFKDFVILIVTKAEIAWAIPVGLRVADLVIDITPTTLP